ncbi:MAG: FeoA family protein [Chitinophagales bacterium]
MNKNRSVLPLGKMKEGESGVIVELERGDLSLKLMEMGFLPGEKIFVDKIAPLGDPISVKIGTYLLSLRKEEANAVLVRSASLVT